MLEPFRVAAFCAIETCQLEALATIVTVVRKLNFYTNPNWSPDHLAKVKSKYNRQTVTFFLNLSCVRTKVPRARPWKGSTTRVSCTWQGATLRGAPRPSVA
eukprot:3670459-Amphidinium_carterae.1